MSSHVRAVILRDLKDIECVKETLEQLEISYNFVGKNLVLSNNIKLQEETEGLRATFNTTNTQANSFLETFVKEYIKNFQAKLERIRLEEAKAKEAVALKQITDEEFRVRQLQLQRERRRLEQIKQQEELAFKQKIDQKVQKIMTRAEKLGYQIQEQVKGKERVLVLVRRR